MHTATRRWLCVAALEAESIGLAGFVEVLEAEVGGLDIAFSTAAIEALALELIGHHAAVLRLLHQCVGDLDFSAFARLGLLDQLEDIRGENIATDDRQVRRRIFRAWLLDHAVDPV